MGWTAFLDACVLYPSGTRDLLLRGAEAYLYRVAWSPHVLEEMRRNLIEDQLCTQSSADALVADMTRAFPEALVEGYQQLIPAMRNDEKDRHVLAAAVAAKADVIVTENVKHFPPEACDPYSVEVQTSDEFLSYAFDLGPDKMGSAFLQQVEEWQKPALDVRAALSRLDQRVPAFADRLRTLPQVRTAAGI